MNLITLDNLSTQKLVDGVVVRPLKINKDESGVLVETLRSDWPEVYGPDRQFFMQYYSVTPPGLARDETVWHYHPTVQKDRFEVINGAIVTAVADNREGSPTKGLLNLFYQKSDEAPFMVLIPEKTLHGFMVVSQGPATLINFPTGLYNPAEEGRIPYAEAQVKTENGETFSWDLVREHFNNK